MSAISKPPYRNEFVDDRRFLTTPWVNFFRDLFIRIGDISALSNTELAESSASLQTSVSSNTTSIATLTSTTAALAVQINDLLQGPVL
jgi:hypothetical protein